MLHSSQHLLNLEKLGMSILKNLNSTHKIKHWTWAMFVTHTREEFWAGNINTELGTWVLHQKIIWF